MQPEAIPLFVDFESFYTQEYSLKKMSPAEYILNPLFEAICMGVASLHTDPMLIDGPEIQPFLDNLANRRKTTKVPLVMVSHNAQFDMAVLSWRFNFIPDLIIDTIALSRTILGPKLHSHSLDTVSRYFGLPSKGTLIKDVKGMGRADIIAAGMWEQESEYCRHDTWLCREIYKKLMPCMPSEELALHDIITRCTTEPVLRLDREVLQQHYAEVMERKLLALSAIQEMGINRSHLMSNQRFADVLRQLGVEPPKKISPHTKEETYAFAKNDEEFVDLLEHPDVMVRTVVEARLETKSTQEETRARRFLAIADLEFPKTGQNTMPMPVIIGAAHTHRFGGAWELNVQNLKRGGRLRDAICADEGHTLLVADSRQIEARFTAWFCDQYDLIADFRTGVDVYSAFASEIFERKVTKENVPERFVGKTGILQLGYASGWLKFGRTVWNNSRQTETPIQLADWQAQDVVNKYRRKYRQIPMTWRTLDQVLSGMNALPSIDSDFQGQIFKCVKFFRQLMMGPTGLPVHFPDLQYIEDKDSPFGGSWFFKDGYKLRRTYGASLLETISQHCSRCIVMAAAVRLRIPMFNIGAKLVHSSHDELVYHVPTPNLEHAKMWVELEMKRPPSWAPDLPLDVETGVGQRYGDAK